MEWFTRREQHILDRKAEILKSFPAVWSNMIKDWGGPDSEDRAWLMYSANYLFRTNNVHWAIDPLGLKQRIPQAPAFDLAQDLKELSFVLLTHEHADHLDLELIRALRHLPIRWIVPEAILQEVSNQADLPAGQIIVPKVLQPIDIEGIRITPFTGLHWEKQSEAGANSLRGVASMAYLIEFKDKRWLFPGDTRTYDARQLPSFGPVDGLFAHLWLGRGCALEEEPSLLDAFCRFFLDLEPRRVILTHLREFGRGADDYWDERHANRICSRIRMMRRKVSVTLAVFGDSIAL